MKDRQAIILYSIGCFQATEESALKWRTISRNGWRLPPPISRLNWGSTLFGSKAQILLAKLSLMLFRARQKSCQVKKQCHFPSTGIETMAGLPVRMYSCGCKRWMELRKWAAEEKRQTGGVKDCGIAGVSSKALKAITGLLGKIPQAHLAYLNDCLAGCFICSAHN